MPLYLLPEPRDAKSGKGHGNKAYTKKDGGEPQGTVTLTNASTVTGVPVRLPHAPKALC